MRPESRPDSLFVVTCDQPQDCDLELWHLGSVQCDDDLGVCEQSPRLVDFMEPRQGSADCDRSPYNREEPSGVAPMPDAEHGSAGLQPRFGPDNVAHPLQKPNRRFDSLRS